MNKENEYYKQILEGYGLAISKYSNPNFDNSDAMCSENHLLNVDMPYCYDEILKKLIKTQEQLKLIGMFMHDFAQLPSACDYCPICKSDYCKKPKYLNIECINSVGDYLFNHSDEEYDNYFWQKVKAEKTIEKLEDENKTAKEYAQKAINHLEKGFDISAKLVLRKIVKGEKLGVAVLD